MKQYEYDHVWTVHRSVDSGAARVVFSESDGWRMEAREVGLEFSRDVNDIQDIYIAEQVVFYPHTSYDTLEINARVVKEVKK